jgi:hypothetical protein
MIQSQELKRRPKQQTPHPSAVEIRLHVERRLPGHIDDLAMHSDKEGRLVMHGRCSSYYVKQMAQQVAMSLAGGQRLVNLISVRPSNPG